MNLSKKEEDKLKSQFLGTLLNYAQINMLPETIVSIEKKSPEELKITLYAYRKSHDEISRKVSQEIKGDMQVFYAGRLKTIADYICKLEKAVSEGDSVIIGMNTKAIKDYFDAFEISLAQYEALIGNT